MIFRSSAAGRGFDRCDIAYVVGLELRDSPIHAATLEAAGADDRVEQRHTRLALQGGGDGCAVSAGRSLLGTDVFKHSAAKEMTCPFTGQKLLAIPALYPDVGIIHVHRADVYGNAQRGRHQHRRLRCGARVQATGHHDRADCEHGRDSPAALRDVDAVLAGGCGVPRPLWKLSGQHALRILFRRSHLRVLEAERAEATFKFSSTSTSMARTISRVSGVEGRREAHGRVVCAGAFARRGCKE